MEIANGVSSPFRAIAPVSAWIPVPAPDGTIILVASWLLGVGVAIAVWGVKWMRMRLVVRSARTVDLAAPVPVRAARTRIEPGVVGIWRPMILLPEGLASRLSPEELQSVISHEVCHLRRRDNFTAAIHTVVEAVFWFYPLTWWLGSRLLAERERACDESVIALGHDPKVYAEGILKVCRFYIESCNSLSRIISDDLWERAQRRTRPAKDETRLRAGGKPKYLLSGLLRCDVCDPHYTITDAASRSCRKPSMRSMEAGM
jgi:hypothetical protein